MDKIITAFVGLDVHKDSTVIGTAQSGREPARFVGTVGPQLPPLLKALAHLGPPEALLIVYEAGPRAATVWRGSCARAATRARWWRRRRFRAGRGSGSRLTGAMRCGSHSGRAPGSW